MTDRKSAPPAVLLAEIRARAEAISLPLTDTESAKIERAVSSLWQSAARVRDGLARNDEPAFGFRHPVPSRHR